MPSPNDFTNQARDRLRGLLGGGGNNRGGGGNNRGGGNNNGGGGGGGGNNNGGGNNRGNNNGGGNNRGGGGGGGGGGGNNGGGNTPGAIGRTCANDRDCGQNTRCDPVTKTCVQRGGGNDGTTPPEEDTGRDCRRNRQCPRGKICNQETGKCDEPGGGADNPTLCGGKKCKDGEVCNNGVCEQPTSGQQCDVNTPCPEGENCVGGVCAKPTPDGELADSDPMTYLYNLSGANVQGAGPGLKMGSVSPFGKFLSNRFNDIVGEYEAQGLTNTNLDFRDWLRTRSQYGNPYLQMGEGGTVGVPGFREPDVAAARAGGNGCTTTADCGPDKPFCVSGKCSATPQLQTIAEYENITPFRNYLRNQYYGASAYDRGISPANFGAGSTRWSAW